MIRWGATVPAAARERLVTYLVTHFGEASRAASAGAATVLPSAPGADQVQRACLTCHGADIIAGQYLTRAQWGKELDKMARWGALFSSEERAAMLDYLASHFGPEATDAR